MLRIRGHQLFGPLDRARHALRAGRQHQLGAVSAQQRAPLLAHRLGHVEHELVAARRGDEGQGDARVAAGRLDDGHARLELAVALGGVDHRHADAVLDAVRRVVEFELRDDLRDSAFSYPVKADERGVADQFSSVLSDFHAYLLYMGCRNACTDKARRDADDVRCWLRRKHGGMRTICDGADVRY